MTIKRSSFLRLLAWGAAAFAVALVGVGCATAGEPVGSVQPTSPASSFKGPSDVRMMPDAAVKKIFGFIDEAVKREDVVDVKLIEDSLDVKRKPIVEGRAYEYFPGASSAIVSRVASGVRNDDAGRLLLQSLQIEIRDPREQCITVDMVK